VITQPGAWRSAGRPPLLAGAGAQRREPAERCVCWESGGVIWPHRAGRAASAQPGKPVAAGAARTAA